MQKSPNIELFNVVVVVGCASKEKKAFFFCSFCFWVFVKKLDKNLFPSIMKSK